jgi:hypothetical protein
VLGVDRMILTDGGRAILRGINSDSQDRHLNQMRYRQEINKGHYDTLNIFRSKSFVANLALMSLTLHNRIIRTYNIDPVPNFIISVGLMVYLHEMRTLLVLTVVRLGFVEIFGYRRLVMQ